MISGWDSSALVLTCWQHIQRILLLVKVSEPDPEDYPSKGTEDGHYSIVPYQKRVL